MAVKHGVFPKRQYILFVPDPEITALSYVNVVFIQDPGAAMGQGTIQHITLSPSVGFTIHLSSTVADHTNFTYEVINPGDFGYSETNIVSGDLSLSGTLTVSGDLYVYGTQYATNTEILSGDQIIEGDLTVKGNTYLGDENTDHVFIAGTISGAVTGENAVIYYDNTNSRLISQNVNDAINELDSYTHEVSGDLKTYIDERDEYVLNTSISWTDTASADLLSRIQSQNELSEILANGNDAANQQIKGLADATDPQDAVTKSQLDSASGDLLNYIDQQDEYVLDTSLTYTDITCAGLVDRYDTLMADTINQANAYTDDASANLIEYIDNKAASQNELDEILANGNSAGNYQIKDLGDPTDQKDAVNKDYADTLVVNASGALSLQIVTDIGNITTNSITVSGLTSNHDVIVDGDLYVTGTEYVTHTETISGDQNIEGDLIVSGDAYITGTTNISGSANISDNLDMTDGFIVNVNDPINNKDAANKQYVDSEIISVSGDLISYIDIHDTSTLESAQTYTDNASAELRNQMIVDDANVLNTSLSYTDTASSNLVNYIDAKADAQNELDEILANGNSAGNQQIKDLAEGVDPQDAITKSYVDIASGNLVLNDLYILEEGNIYTDSVSANLVEYIDTRDGYVLDTAQSYTDTASANLTQYIDDKTAAQNELHEILANGNNAGVYEIDMNGNKIVNVETPTVSGDATNKDYIDTEITSASGNLQNLTEIRYDQSITYTDNASADLLSRILAQNELSEILANGNDAANQQIKELGDPTDLKDAVHKHYVDTLVDYTSGALDLQKVTDNGNITTNGITVDSLNVTADTVVQGDLYVRGTEYISQTEVITGDQIIRGTLTVDGDVYLGNETSDTVYVSGNLDMQGRPINNLADPVDGTDAVNKNYVDTEIQGASGDLYNYINTRDENVLDEAKTYTDDACSNLIYYVDTQDAQVLANSITYTDNASADIIQYVDNKASSQNELSEILANGNSANGIIITASPTPSGDSDVTNKAYVDALVAANNDLQEVTDNGNTTTNSIITSGSLIAGQTLVVSGNNLVVDEYGQVGLGIGAEHRSSNTDRALTIQGKTVGVETIGQAITGDAVIAEIVGGNTESSHTDDLLTKIEFSTDTNENNGRLSLQTRDDTGVWHDSLYINGLGTPVFNYTSLFEQDLRVDGDLYVSGQAYIAVTESVTGDIVYEGDVTIHEDLWVYGNSFLGNDPLDQVLVSGTFFASGDINTLSDVQIGGKLDMTNGYIEHLAAPTDPDHAANKEYVDSVTGGSTGNIFYTNSTPMPVDVGGWAAGSTFDAVSNEAMWTGLLYPYQEPTFSSFSISGQTTPIEVGDSILANPTFLWTTTNSSNVSGNSIDLRDVTGAVDLATGLANDGSESVIYGAITKTSATTNVFRISGINTQSNTFTRNYTVTWQWKRYYGEDTTTPLTETDIESLRVSGLSSGFAGTYAFNAGGYKYLCYASVLGTATTFKDEATSLDVPFEPVYTVSVTNGFAVTTNYNVHRSTNIIGSAINIIVT